MLITRYLFSFSAPHHANKKEEDAVLLAITIFFGFLVLFPALLAYGAAKVFNWKYFFTVL